MRLVHGDQRVSVWSRGVDRSLFSPDRRDTAWRHRIGLAADETAILFFGRLVIEKGLRTFVEVIRSLQQRGVRVRALVVGAGPAADELRRLPDAILTGHLDGAELARAVASSDIMLAPSTTETFGNVMLEAMASGLSVVSADAPSARAMLSDGETGLLCRLHILDDYVAQTERLVSDVDVRRNVGVAARRASVAFSWDATSESVLRAYASLPRIT